MNGLEGFRDLLRIFGLSCQHCGNLCDGGDKDVCCDTEMLIIHGVVLMSVVSRDF